MIDLHTHILPAVDDGAADWEEAVAMCRAAADDGCEALVATPHQRHPLWWNDDLERLERQRIELQSRVGPFPRILLGAEVRADGEVLEAVDSLEGARPLIRRLCSSRYVLVELGPELGPQPEFVVHEMVVAGWTPVLAHPECIPWLAADLDRLRGLVELGALLQTTAMSVTGDFGRLPKEAVHGLLGRDLVHVLSSDCHGVDHRPPGLSRARAVVERRYGIDLAARITEVNPRAIVEDRVIDVAA